MSSDDKKSSARKTRSQRHGGAEGTPEPETEQHVHGDDDGQPSTPTAIEQRLTQRILALEAMKGQGMVFTHIPPTPFNQEVENGNIGSLSSQKADNTPAASTVTGPYGGLSPSVVPSATMGIASGTEIGASESMTKQIKAMNDIFMAIDLCHEQQNKLGLKESQAMFELAEASSDEEGESSDETGQPDSTPHMGAQGHGNSSGDESDSDEADRADKSDLRESAARKKLLRIQGGIVLSIQI